LLGHGPSTAEGNLAVIGGAGGNPILDLSLEPVHDRRRIVGRLGELGIPLLHRGFLYGSPGRKSAPARLEAYDLRDPESPVLIQRLDNFNYRHPAAAEDLFVVGAIYGGGGPLIAFHILPEGRLERAAEFGEQGDGIVDLIEVWKSWVYAGYDRQNALNPGHLNVHDLSDPENPLDVGRIDGPGDPIAATLVDSILVVSWNLSDPPYSNWLYAYDLGVDPTEPPTTFSWLFEDNSDLPRSLASDDRFLYAVGGWPRLILSVYDFAAPQPWRPIQEIPLWWGDNGGALAVADHALIRNDNGSPHGTTIFPRRADGTLGPRTRFGLWGTTSDVAIVGDHLYADADRSGALVFEIGPQGSLRQVQRARRWCWGLAALQPEGPIVSHGYDKLELITLAGDGSLDSTIVLEEWPAYSDLRTAGAHLFMLDSHELIAADLVGGDTLVHNSFWTTGGTTTDLLVKVVAADTLLALTSGSLLNIFRFTAAAGLDLVADQSTGYDTAFPGLFDDPIAGPCAVVHGDDGGVETYDIDLANGALVLLDSVRFRPRYQAWSCSVVGDQAWLGASDSLFVAQLLPGGRIGEILRQESINTVWGHATGIGSSKRVALPSGKAGVVVYEQPSLSDRGRDPSR